MTPQLITPPVGSLVTLALIKAHCRVDGTDDDALLTHYADAAAAYLDGRSGVLGRAVLAQTWRQEFSGWGALRLALPDVQSVEVFWRDAAGDWVALDDPAMERSGSETLVTATGPSTDAVRVDYVCAMPGPMLAKARQAALLMIGHWYRSRETVVVGTTTADLPFGSRSLIAALRWGII